ncbi:MAG TPA: toll/interleukin-1 receptor domain-containing protein [Bryobacteraceae bacterium]|nr:toll/interleukin-1 receptor domain-containing protein [Bryobacteraceae bacterium]
MQALTTTTIFLCHAAEDRETAVLIAEFLERGADVRIFREEGELRRGEDLAAKAREGRMADIVLVLFSRHSLRRPWPRSEWEDALLKEPAEEGVRIGFVKCDDCVPPRVLAPQFELNGLRQLKRWIRGSGPLAGPFRPDLEALGIAIADRPGTETVASAALAGEFVNAFRDDFDEVLFLDCAGRSPASLAGDLGAQLGLLLEGDCQSNLDRLRDFCSARRLLIVCAGVEPRLTFGGRCSTLIVTEPGATLQPQSGDAIRAVQHAFFHATEWPEICSLARQGRRLTREQRRFAECYELMQHWYAAADALDDRLSMVEPAREMVWILEAWGREEEARRLEHERLRESGQQMLLF